MQDQNRATSGNHHLAAVPAHVTGIITDAGA
jgi:hypothetical protein